MNKEIRKYVINDIESTLDEMDFDTLFSLETLKDKINEYVDKRVRETIASEIQNRVILKMKKAYPILDENIMEIVNGIMYKINSEITKDE